MDYELTNFSSEKFINEILIVEVNNLIKSGFDYFAFLIIAQGIELFGNLICSKPFDEQNLSRARFKEAIKHLFDKDYEKYSDDLYSGLRCGMAHQLRPGSKFKLTSLKNKIPEDKHLETRHGSVILIVEKFFEDFKTAFSKLKKHKLLQQQKMNAIQINISHVKFENKTFIVTGGI